MTKSMPAIPRSVVLYGLEETLARDLRTALTHDSLNVRTVECADLMGCVQAVDHGRRDVIFCDSSSDLLSLLHAVRKAQKDVPVVVVSRHAEERAWLDALEAGASDYCAAPFEVHQLSWILRVNPGRL